jgi:hypothetical protein
MPAKKILMFEIQSIPEMPPRPHPESDRATMTIDELIHYHPIFSDLLVPDGYQDWGWHPEYQVELLLDYPAKTAKIWLITEG